MEFKEHETTNLTRNSSEQNNTDIVANNPRDLSNFRVIPENTFENLNNIGTDNSENFNTNSQNDFDLNLDTKFAQDQIDLEDEQKNNKKNNFINQENNQQKNTEPTELIEKNDFSNNSMILKSNHNPELVSSTDLNFLIVNYFHKTDPELGNYLFSHLKNKNSLPKSYYWDGEEKEESYDQLTEKYSNIGNQYLVKLLSSVVDQNSKVPRINNLIDNGGILKRNSLKVDLKMNKNNINIHSHLLRNQVQPNNRTQPPKIDYNYQKLKTVRGHFTAAYCVKIDRTNTRVFTGSDDSVIKIWSLVTGRLIKSLRGHSGDICDLAVNYENTFLASCSNDNYITIWSLLDYSQKTTFCCLGEGRPHIPNNTSGVTTIEFSPSPSCKYLFSADFTGMIRLWPTDDFDKPPIVKESGQSTIICSNFSCGGNHLVTAGYTDIVVWSIEDPEIIKIAVLTGHISDISSIEFSSDCRILSGSEDGSRIWTFNKKSNSFDCTICCFRTLDSQPTVTGAIWSSDGKYTIVADHDHQIKIWESKTGKLFRTLKRHTRRIYVLERSNVDNIILSAGYDGQIILWDIVTGEALKVFVTPSEVLDCKFSTDSDFFCITNSAGELFIFGTGSGYLYKDIPDQQFFISDGNGVVRNADNVVVDRFTNLNPAECEDSELLCTIDTNVYDIQPSAAPPLYYNNSIAMNNYIYAAQKEKRKAYEIEHKHLFNNVTNLRQENSVVLNPVPNIPVEVPERPTRLLQPDIEDAFIHDTSSSSDIEMEMSLPSDDENLVEDFLPNDFEEFSSENENEGSEEENPARYETRNNANTVFKKRGRKNKIKNNTRPSRRVNKTKKYVDEFSFSSSDSSLDLSGSEVSESPIKQNNNSVKNSGPGRKIYPPWVTTSDKIFRNQIETYVPQLDDKVVFFKQGYMEYCEFFDHETPLPWETDLQISTMEYVTIVDIRYDVKYLKKRNARFTQCLIALSLNQDPTKVFNINYHPSDCPEFLVFSEKVNKSLEKNWLPSEEGKFQRFKMYFQDSPKPFFGSVIASFEDENFVGSPWESLIVLWDESSESNSSSDNTKVSPWEIFAVDSDGNEISQNEQKITKEPMNFFPQVLSLPKNQSIVQNFDESVKNENSVNLNPERNELLETQNILEESNQIPKLNLEPEIEKKLENSKTNSTQNNPQNISEETKQDEKPKLNLEPETETNLTNFDALNDTQTSLIQNNTQNSEQKEQDEKPELNLEPEINLTNLIQNNSQNISEETKQDENPELNLEPETETNLENLDTSNCTQTNLTQNNPQNILEETKQDEKPKLNLEPEIETNLENLDTQSINTISNQDKLLKQDNSEIQKNQDNFTDNEKQLKIYQILNDSFELDFAQDFRYPVDFKNILLYKKIIGCPMDLNTILERIQNFFYRSNLAILFDIYLIKKNAEIFNEKDSEITKFSIELLDWILDKFEEFELKLYYEPILEPILPNFDELENPNTNSNVNLNTTVNNNILNQTEIDDSKIEYNFSENEEEEAEEEEEAVKSEIKTKRIKLKQKNKTKKKKDDSFSLSFEENEDPEFNSSENISDFENSSSNSDNDDDDDENFRQNSRPLRNQNRPNLRSKRKRQVENLKPSKPYKLRKLNPNPNTNIDLSESSQDMSEEEELVETPNIRSKFNVKTKIRIPLLKKSM